MDRGIRYNSCIEAGMDKEKMMSTQRKRYSAEVKAKEDKQQKITCLAHRYCLPYQQ